MNAPPDQVAVERCQRVDRAVELLPHRHPYAAHVHLNCIAGTGETGGGARGVQHVLVQVQSGYLGILFPNALLGTQTEPFHVCRSWVPALNEPPMMTDPPDSIAQVTSPSRGCTHGMVGRAVPAGHARARYMPPACVKSPATTRSPLPSRSSSVTGPFVPSPGRTTERRAGSPVGCVPARSR